jgi:hypothetical protein
VRRVADLTRRFILAGLLAAAAAWGRAAIAADIAIEVVKGTGDSTVHVLRAPSSLLDRGGSVDGLPALRDGKPETIAWPRMRHLVFIPGDIPTVIITYRDGREDMVDVEPCRLVSGNIDIDIHDVADIRIR